MTPNLFDFDFTRYEMVALFLVPALVNFLIAAYISFFLHKGRTNNVFSIFVFLLGVWQMLDGFVHLSRFSGAAYEWNVLSGIACLFVAPFGVLFVLRFTRWHKSIPDKIIFGCLFLPAIILAGCMFLKLETYTILFSEDWYWIANPNQSTLSYFISMIVSLQGLIILAIPLVFYLRGNEDNIKKKQTLLLLVGLSIPVLTGITIEIALPIFLEYDNEPVTTPLMTFFSVAAFIAIKKYKLLDYSPKHQWESIIESMNEGLLIVNRQDEIMYANKTFCDLVGYEFSEIRGKVAKDLFIDDEEQRQFIEKQNKNREQKISDHYEMLLKTKSGKKIWMMISGAPYFDSKGNVIGSIGIQTNIDKLKETEEELRRREERFRVLVENNADCITLNDCDGKIIYISSSIKKILGYEPEEIIGRNSTEFFHPDDLRQKQKWFSELKESPGKEVKMQWRKRHKNGSWVWLDGISCNMLHHAAVGAIVTNFRDISDIKNASKALTQKEKKLRQAIEIGRMVTMDVDFLDETIAFSQNAKEVLGLECEINGYFNFIQYVHPDDQALIQNSFRNNILRNKASDIEFRFIRPDSKQIIWIERRMELVHDASGKVIGATGLLIDITRKKESEGKATILTKEIQDYRYALDESSIVAITDHSGIIKYVNDNFCKISKYGRDEVIGKDHRIINSSHHSKEFFRSLWSTIANGNVWRGEIKNKAKDGTFYWEDTTIVPFINTTGKPYQYIAIRSDITERKLYEEKIEKSTREMIAIKNELEENEAKLKEAQAIAHFGNWELDFATGVAIWSEEACRIYGLEPSENKLSYDIWMSFIHPEDRQYVLSETKKAQENLSESAFYHRIILRDGTVKHIHSRSKFKLNEKNIPIGIYGVAHDVTEEKKAEEKLNELSQRLLLATNSAKIGIFDWNIKDNVLVWDENMYALFGADDKTQDPLEVSRKCVHHDDIAKIDKVLKKALLCDREYHLEFRVIWPNNEIHYLVCNAIILRDSENNAIRMIGVNRDDTKQKLAEENLKTVNKELETYIYKASHDLRTPITSILGLTHVSKYEIDDEKAMAYLKKIEKTARKLDDTLSGLVQSMTIKDTREFKDRIEFKRVIKETVAKYELWDEFKTIQVHAEIKSQKQFVSNAYIVESLFQNIIENAIKYQKTNMPGAYLRMQVSDTPKGVQIVFEDNGIGIEEQVKEKVFDMYYRATASSTGSGLGLYLVKIGVEKLGGTIQLQSALNKGTTMTLNLPCLC